MAVDKSKVEYRDENGVRLRPPYFYDEQYHILRHYTVGITGNHDKESRWAELLEPPNKYKKKKEELHDVHTKAELVKLADERIKLLKQENKKLAKVHRVRDIEDLEVIARLEVANKLLAKRLATDAIVVATEEPTSSLSVDERKERKRRMDEMREMLTLVRGLHLAAKELKADLEQSINDGVSAQEIPEHVAAIEDARRTLAAIGLDFDDSQATEVIECQDASQSH